MTEETKTAEDVVLGLLGLADHFEKQQQPAPEEPVESEGADCD